MLIEKETVNRSDFLKLLSPAEKQADAESEETSRQDTAVQENSEQPGSPDSEDQKPDDPESSYSQGAD